jgi:hypothetical protein
VCDLLDSAEEDAKRVLFRGDERFEDTTCSLAGIDSVKRKEGGGDTGNHMMKASYFVWWSEKEEENDGGDKGKSKASVVVVNRASAVVHRTLDVLKVGKGECTCE